MSYGHPNHYESNRAWFQATPKGYGRRNGKPTLPPYVPSRVW